MYIKIHISAQRLELNNDLDEIILSYSIATSRFGCGEKKNSYQTPRGKHIIRSKIGEGAPVYSVFKSRRIDPNHKIFSEDLVKTSPEQDWILTRILWLSGTEIGFNRLGDVDTMQRYIYIHGCPDSVILGQPSSIGCIRMHSHDLIELFSMVSVGTIVNIIE